MRIDKFLKVSRLVKRRTVAKEMADQGAGFVIGSQPKGSGLGLYGMQERAEIVGGSVNIESKIGKGTNIKLKVPIA